MGQCKDCKFYTGTRMFGTVGYCSVLTERKWGKDYYKEVRSKDTCKHFTHIDTDKNSGYKGKDPACFLTTACCGYLQKPDDCEELTKLRTFRDTYIKNLENGDSLIKEYYALAPSIVEKLDSSNQKDEYYQYIYTVIKTCIQHIENNQNEEALQLYKNMVLRLKEL